LPLISISRQISGVVKPSDELTILLTCPSIAFSHKHHSIKDRGVVHLKVFDPETLITAFKNAEMAIWRLKITDKCPNFIIRNVV